MKVALAFIVFVGCCLVGMAQKSIFERFDFEKGGYSLLARPLQSWISDNSGPPFYIQGIDHLNNIKSMMRLFPNHKWYWGSGAADLSILVCKNGRILESIGLFTDLQMVTVASKSEQYEFDGYFPMEGYELAVVRRDTFSELAIARATLDSLSRLPGLLCILPPPWKELDGEFTFRIEGSFHKVDAMEREVRAKMEARFPGIPYWAEAKLKSGDWLHGMVYDVTIGCSRDIADQFDIYPRQDRNWSPYTLTLESFWEQ